MALLIQREPWRWLGTSVQRHPPAALRPGKDTWYVQYTGLGRSWSSQDWQGKYRPRWVSNPESSNP
jgi:hypothetical protein